MANEGVNTGRRRFLTAAASAMGAVGIVYTAVPFIESWKPSARARAAGAPVEADIGKVEPGQLVQFEWRGRPVWVVRRTERILELLPELNDKLVDPMSENVDQQPSYAQNLHRSRRPEVLVLVGKCTHLGCSPKFVPEVEPQSFDPEWKGGFFCPCHGSKFDMAGRVYKGVPAPTNLVVPPYVFLDDDRILIGADKKGAA